MKVWSKQTVRWVLNGKNVSKRTPNATKRVILSKRLYGTLNAYDGRKRQVPLTEDKATSETLLRRLQTLEDEKRANGVDRYHDDRLRPLLEHLDEYEAYLTAKGNTSDHVTLQIGRCRKIVTAIKASLIGELDGSRIVTTLASWRGRKKKSIGIASSNHYVTAVKGFSRWLWCERRTPDDPLSSLRKMNADVDRRRVRRALTPDELNRLLLITQQSTKCYKGRRIGWRLRGVDRALVYEVAALTGLRSAEFGSLTKASFDFDGGLMTLEATNVKNRRRTTLPLHPTLNVKLRSYCETVNGETLFPWLASSPKRLGLIFKRDLKAAGIAHVDAAGRYADFHSLRYTFITSLARAGVHPAKAQRLARHSTVSLTMNVYTALDVDDLRDAVAALPSPTSTVSSASPKTQRDAS